MTHISQYCDSYGILLRREALDRGLRDETLIRLVRLKVLTRIRQGAYVLTDIWHKASPAERHNLLARSVLRLYSDDVVLSHASSCIWQGGPDWGIQSDAVDLTDVKGRNGRKQARVVHHRGVCPEDDVVTHDGLRTTKPARAVVEVLSVDGLEPALVQANHFLHAGQMSLEELHRFTRTALTWPGSLAAESLWRLATPLIESVGETRTYLAMWRHGVPLPDCQVDIADANGVFIGRVDFAWCKERVIVEFDGLSKYAIVRPGEDPAAALVREKLREDALRANGWTVIRLTWADLNRPEAMAARIRNALSRSAVA